jgi:hypothetical protein
MVALVADVGMVEFPDLLVEAVARNARFTAELTGSFLREVIGNGNPLSLPGNFLLDLAAVLELRYRESLGPEIHKTGGLPGFREAAEDLFARVAKGPTEFEGPDAASLSRQVLCFWLERFAWEACNLLGTEIVLSDMDEAACADLVAEFLWEHRHDITKLTSAKE